MTFPTFNNGDPLPASDLNAVGMWLVRAQTVTAGGTSVLITNAFNGDFDNYRVVMTDIGGGSGTSAFMTLNGSAGATYSWAGRFWGYTVPAGDASSGAPNAGGFWLGITGTNFSGSFDIQNPFLLKTTKIVGQSSGATYGNAFHGYDSATTASDGFTITLASGTLGAGTVKVYGYRN
jgi:hypothetical protein